MARLLTGFKTLARQFEHAYSVKVILVDDGSSDGTGDRATQLAAGLDFTLLTHPVNLGPGRAFATAFAYLRSRLNATDWVVTLEGDNTSQIELLQQMFQRANEGFDVILASPYLYGGAVVNTSSFRAIISRIANVFVKEFLDIFGIFTVSSFFRLYRSTTIQRLQAVYGDGIIEFAGFEGIVELLIKMVYLQTRISEVAMVLDTKQRVGKSKMNILETSFGYLELWQAKARWKASLHAYSAEQG